MWLSIVGLGAGTLTTLTGMGGGIMLVTLLAVAIGAESALVVSALALWVGNAHRLFLYRGEVRLDIAVPMALGIVPGAVIVATALPGIPNAVLYLAILAVSLLAVVRMVFRFTWRAPRRVLVPVGFVIGGLAATAGGAGLLVAPLLLGLGLTSGGYLATASLLALTMHLSRLAGYALGGLVTVDRLWLAATIAVAIVLGNTVGAALRRRLPVKLVRLFEASAPAICVWIAAVALFG